ncbi:MAG: hypothetical protein CR994_03395 [Maribacter sp.]|nr:MAG: hypothetical protein CR994_03395 [Maribacter sp.]
MNKTIFCTGITFGVLAVILGAFGAHGLEKMVGADALQAYETGVKYQMYHALFLLVLANTDFLREENKKIVFYFILVGILLFSFFIYLLTINALVAFDFKKIALLTPFGGTFLIIGWLVLAYQVIKTTQRGANKIS